MLHDRVRPGLAGVGRAASGRVAVADRPQSYSSTARRPVALSIQKRSRPCIVAKITFLDGEPVLAVAHRNQHGVDTTVSIPTAVLGYAQDRGCRWFYLRRDNTGEMMRIGLADLQKPGIGWLKTSCGIAEWFIKLEKMQPVPWRRWAYAERIVQLQTDPQPESAGQQLPLLPGFGG